MEIQYFVIQCKKCGKHSAKQCKEGVEVYSKVFKCVYCNKSSKINKKNQVGLSNRIYGPYSAKESPLIVARLNEKR